MKTKVLVTVVAVALSSSALAQVADSVIAEQRAQLAANTAGKGFGPQSPRDLDQEDGNNLRLFSEAPSHTQMNLCNIHFHAAAEHKGGEFTTYAGNGDGEGYDTGYVYNGTLAQELLAPPSRAICPGPKVRCSLAILLKCIMYSRVPKFSLAQRLVRVSPTAP